MLNLFFSGSFSHRPLSNINALQIDSDCVKTVYSENNQNKEDSSVLPSKALPKPYSEAMLSRCTTVDLINSHFSYFLITNQLPASINSLNRCISQCWGHPSHHEHNKRMSLSADLIAVSVSLCGIVLLLGLIQNDRLIFCVSAGDIELEEEVWTCGVDCFSHCVRKFDSPAADINVIIELSLLSNRRKQSGMLPAHIKCL